MLTPSVGEHRQIYRELPSIPLRVRPDKFDLTLNPRLKSGDAFVLWNPPIRRAPGSFGVDVVA